MKKIEGKTIKTVQCPYVAAHIMPQDSLLNHLTRCSAPNKHLFTKCKYNPVHVYPKTQIEQHYKRCKDRLKYQKQGGSQSEDWDSDNEKKNTTQISNKPSNVPTTRQTNRSRQQGHKNSLNASSIKKISINDSDSDSWDQLILESDHQQIQNKPSHQNTSISLNQNTSISSNQGPKLLNTSNQQKYPQKHLSSQNHQSSKFKYPHTNKQNTIKNNQKQGKYHANSLDSESFSYKEESQLMSQSNQKRISPSVSEERSYETLKSSFEDQKNRDNQKNNKSELSDQDLDIDDF